MARKTLPYKAHLYLYKRHNSYGRLLRGYRAYRLPWRKDVAIYRVLRGLFFRLQKDKVSVRAAAVAYNFFLALLPGLIFLFTLLPYLPIPDLSESVLEYMQSLMPQSAFDAISNTLQDILTRPRVSLLSSGLLLSIYLASTGIHTLLDLFKRRDEETFLKKRLRSIAITIGFGILLVLCLAMLFISKLVVTYLILNTALSDTLVVIGVLLIRGLILFLLLYVSAIILYRQSDAYQNSYSDLRPGAIIASLLSIIASLAFGEYVDSFGNYNRLYGSLGALIITLVWIHVNATVLIIGYELNRSINSAKRRKVAPSING